MLLELYINDFAIIDSLRVGFQPGFTALTGETGAGKSIIIDALGCLRGDKVTPSMVRAGCTRARIEGVFHIANMPDVLLLLREHGVLEDEGEPLILTREINADSGRSMARINGRTVNNSLLRDVGSRLIDIHGQHEGLSLFNTRMHLELLDRYGGLVGLREEIGERYAQLRVIRDEIITLQQNEAHRLARIEEMRLLVEDVGSAEIQPHEEQRLLQERSVVHHAARIAELYNRAYNTLYHGKDIGTHTHQSVVDGLATVVNDLVELARLDPSTLPMAEQATDLQLQVQELAIQLRDYVDSAVVDPHRIEEIEDRLAIIRRLKRTYGDDIPQLLARAASAEAEIEQLTQSAEHIQACQQREQTLLHELGTRASLLSQRRAETGASLSRAIEHAMSNLAMPHVQFAVSITHEPDERGVAIIPAPHNDTSHDASNNNGTTPSATMPTSAPRYRVGATGIDIVEFMLSSNPGEPLKPLVRIASGGESSRLLLALKSILSQVDVVPTLIFDEVDVGVGGRAGQVVGHTLWEISNRHQVICITHLPQVAAFANSHYAITKHIVDDAITQSVRTQTTVRYLCHTERIDELAAMLDGTPVSDHSRVSAREIIERANSIKSGEYALCRNKQP